VSICQPQRQGIGFTRFIIAVLTLFSGGTEHRVLAGRGGMERSIIVTSTTTATSTTMDVTAALATIALKVGVKVAGLTAMATTCTSRSIV